MNKEPIFSSAHKFKLEVVGKILVQNVTEPLVTQKKRIFVVDDDQTVLTSTVRVLDKRGVEADTAETGQEAIKKSRKQH